MSLKKLPKLSNSLALRLTIWYATIFAVSSSLAFACVFALTIGFVAERTDDDMQQDIDEYSLLFQQDGIERIKQEMALDTKGDEAEKAFFRLWTDDGRLLAATGLSTWQGLVSVPENALRDIGDVGEPLFDTLKLSSRDDTVRTVTGSIGPRLILEIGQSLEDNEAFLTKILNGFLLTLAVVLLLGGPIGWFMARRALRGVREITRTANEIANGALERRVPVGSRGNELDKLAWTFNTMLDRIHALIFGMRDMADNLAHDLRTPLARIRAAAEQSLSTGEANAARDALAVNTIEECDRLLALVNTTLDIAEADSGAAKLNLSRIDLVGMVLGACELFQTVAEDNHVSLVTRMAGHCQIQGDRQRLQRVIANLIDNALKYTPAGGQVTVALRQQDGRAVLTVEDSGVGISAEDLPRIFQRFYRCDSSRSQQGIGLGLNLALAFVRAHGGDITVLSTPDVGSSFSVTLPRPPSGVPLQTSRITWPQTTEQIDAGT